MFAVNDFETKILLFLTHAKDLHFLSLVNTMYVDGTYLKQFFGRFSLFEGFIVIITARWRFVSYHQNVVKSMNTIIRKY